MTDDRATLNYQEFIEYLRSCGSRPLDQCADRIEALMTLLMAATGKRTQIDHRIVAQVEALTAERDAAKQSELNELAALKAEVASLTAECDGLRKKRKRLAEIVTGLEKSRRKLHSLSNGAHRRVVAVEAERDALIRDRDRWAAEAQVNTSPIVAGLTADNERLREALEDIADGMGEMSHAEIGRYAPAIARAALNPGKADT
jgi:chromosome segregation ATPase